MSRHKHKEKSRIIASKIAEVCACACVGDTCAGASSLPGAQGVTLHFSADRVIGNGSFGVVFEATVAETGEIVAIKKVLQDKRFKVRAW